MTLRHTIEGLMIATKSASHSQLSRRLGIEHATVSRMHAGINDCRLSLLQRMSLNSGLPLAQLVVWFELPAEADMPYVAPVGWPRETKSRASA